MSNYFPVVVAFALLLSFSGCRNRQQATNQIADSTAAGISVTKTATDVSITGRLADLGLTTDSDWRGINLGDDFSKVKVIEKAYGMKAGSTFNIDESNTAEKGEPFESDANHSGYTVEFKNLETADVLYYQANQKVSAIDVDLFLNSRQSVDEYQKELNPYFTARYGAPKPGTGGTVWTGQNGETVTLKDVSKGKDFGLKIKIAPAGGATTASAK